MKFCIKITLYMLGILSILFGISGSLLISTSFYNILEREQETVYNSYQMVLSTLQIINSMNNQSDYKDISNTLKQLSEQNAGSWTALRLYTETKNIYNYGSFGITKIDKPKTTGNCEIRYISSDQLNHALIISGMLEAGDEVLYLDISRDITPLFVMRQSQQQIYQFVFIMMSCICVFISYSISRVLTYPLVSLSKVSRAIATGELSSRANIKSNDEIGLVAHDFNAMAEILEDNISQLKDLVEKQERFMGSFAHEMKTPMTSIIGYADLIREQILNSDEQIEAANYIVNEGKRLESLSQKLLNILVLKNTQITFSKIHLATLIQNLANHMEMIYAKQGITLICECDDGVCFVEPDLIKSLLINLWDNACKSMVKQKTGNIYVCSEILSDGCRILIQDNGCGIPPESLKHLTEAFYRVDKSRSQEQGGVGLGLSLCQEIVSLHNGSIEFKSQIGEGTIVIIELKGGIV